MTIGYNPDFNPTGIEGGIDTNLVPWIDLPQAPGMSIKSLRASSESGMFTVVARVKKGTRLGELVHLGAMDMLVLSGSMTYAQGPMAGTLHPGTWGYVPANARIAGLSACASARRLIRVLPSRSPSRPPTRASWSGLLRMLPATPAVRCIRISSIPAACRGA